MNEVLDWDNCVPLLCRSRHEGASAQLRGPSGVGVGHASAVGRAGRARNAAEGGRPRAVAAAAQPSAQRNGLRVAGGLHAPQQHAGASCSCARAAGAAPDTAPGRGAPSPAARARTAPAGRTARQPAGRSRARAPGGCVAHARCVRPSSPAMCPSGTPRRALPRLSTHLCPVLADADFSAIAESRCDSGSGSGSGSHLDADQSGSDSRRSDASSSGCEQEEGVALGRALSRGRELLVAALPRLVGFALALMLSGATQPLHRRPPRRRATHTWAEWEEEASEEESDDDS